MTATRGLVPLVTFLVLLGGGAVCASWFVPFDPVQVNLGQRLVPPGMSHLFGTDELGRDLLSRVMVGFANTVQVSILCFVTSFIIGVFAGTLAGINYQGIVDRVFNWLAAMIFSLPFLLIISAILSLADKNLFNAYLVLTAIIWVSPARIVRAGVIRARTRPYVMAERAMGLSESRIAFRTLIPASIQPAFLFSFKYFPEIIGMEAGLSFLGLGVQPPHPGLGQLIFNSIDYLTIAWWYAFFPAMLLFVVVLASNLFYKRLVGRQSQVLEGA